MARPLHLSWAEDAFFGERSVHPRWLILALTLAFVGCEFEARPDPPLRVTPPDGNGTTVDDDGTQRTRLRGLGTLSYGQTVEGVVRPAVLFGYVFHAGDDDAPALALELEGPGVVLLAVYGPQASTGTWGKAIASAHGANTVSVALDPVAQGAYFVLVKSLDGGGPDYALSLSCDGCAEPACADSAPCDLFCPDGLEEANDETCYQCRCAETAGCADDEECPGDRACLDARCVAADEACRQRECENTVAPVCGSDRLTYPNACWARCHGVERFTAGECGGCDGDGQCPQGQRCLDGQCRPPNCDHCNAEPEEPVCGARDLRYRNRCALGCAGDTFVHFGRCVRSRCQSDEECDETQRCRPYRDGRVPNNTRFCLQDPNGPSCIRRCVAVPPAPPRCGPDLACPEPSLCYPDGRDGGVCVPACRLAANAVCPVGFECAATRFDDVASGRGICLPNCRLCQEHPALQCRPDLAGNAVCQTCQCEALPADPVCVGRAQYRNACAAQCDGQERISRCSVVMPPIEGCTCAPDWAPICIDERVYANPCEARCRQLEGPATPLAQCLPPTPADPLRCETDENCERTCGGVLCANLELNACPALAPLAQCISAAGVCACVEGHCGFRPTERTRQCSVLQIDSSPRAPR